MAMILQVGRLRLYRRVSAGERLIIRLETCGPYTAFKEAGFNVSFATEAGKSPQCDTKMLEGLTQRLLVSPLRKRVNRDGI